MEKNTELLKRRSQQASQKHPLNILIIGLDSLARPHYLRQLSKSLSYFQNQLRGSIFNGFSIVGDGTTAALLAMLFGVFENEIHETRRGFPGATSLDDIGSIFKDFRKHGYVTHFDETGKLSVT